MCEYEKYIITNLVELSKRTNCTPNVLNRCFELQILSSNDVDELKLLIDTPQEKATKFWKKIITRKDCIPSLVNTFLEDAQNQVSDILDKAVRDDGSDQKYNFMKNLKPLDVQVLRPKEIQKHENNSYKLDPDIIGAALLINVTVFKNARKNRPGAVQDSVYMKNLWGQLGYKVFPHEGKIMKQDLLENKMLKFLEQFRKNPTWQSCVVFIGTHGENGMLEMADDSVAVYNDLISHFVNCEDLKGKPKIFIFEACQKTTGQDPEPYISNTDDLILCFPNVPGGDANRDKHLGSWFIYTLTDVFMNKAYKLELREMLAEVQKNMFTKIQYEGEKAQVPFWLDFDGLKPLYFNVAPEDE